MVRGIDRSQLFYDDDDREGFLGRIRRFAGACDARVYAWCLMDSHVHLVLQAGSESVSSLMSRILVSYAASFNSKYDRVGHLFQDRFRSKEIENDAYLMGAIRYVVRNPLEIGDSVTQWTSFSETIDGGGLTDSAAVLALFSDSEQEAKALFGRFCLAGECEERFRFEAEKGRLRSRDAIAMIKEIAGIEFCQDLCKLDRASRDKAICAMRARGLSIRQISRLTGISRGVAERARKRVCG